MQLFSELRFVFYLALFVFPSVALVHRFVDAHKAMLAMGLVCNSLTISVYAAPLGTLVCRANIICSKGRHQLVFYSRSYAEDVTSVTSGASQGPHSFNLVFVCLCVCVTPGAIPYLSRTVPYHQTQLATYSWPQYSNRAFKRKIIT